MEHNASGADGTHEESGVPVVENVSLEPQGFGTAAPFGGLSLEPNFGVAAFGDAAVPGEALVAADPPRSKRKRVLVGAAVLVLIAAGVAVGLSVGAGNNADASVVNAVTSTLSDRTANMTLGGSIGLDGHTITISGTGVADFTQNAARFAMKLGGLGAGGALSSFASNSVFVGGTDYTSLSGSALSEINTLFPGKSWLAIDMSQLGGGNSTSQLGLGASS
jgi:hypothetical protein